MMQQTTLEERPDGVTAFRAAEKRYKLAPQQQGRSRRRGQDVVSAAIPADFPDLLDFTHPEGIQQLVVHDAPKGLQTEPLQRIYSLSTHPGFFFLPGAVPPEAQRSFLEDVAGRLLEPPAATNLSAAHGSLPGLWRAAAQDLKLRQPLRPQHQPGSPPAKRKAAPQAALVAPAAVPAVAAGAASLITSAAKPCSGALYAPAVPAGPAASSGGGKANPEPSAFEAVWSADGVGPAAAALLWKLRWLTVGPRYDWTARVYDFEGPHHPLPDYAADLARRLVAAVEMAVPREHHTAQQRHGGGDAAAGASEHARAGGRRGGAVAPTTGRCTCQQHGPGPGHGQLQSMHSCAAGQAQLMPQALVMHGGTPCQPACVRQRPLSQPPQHAQQQAEAPPAPPAVCHACQPAAQQEQQQQQQPEARSATFTPDAALVCFYRAGDTLCGHRDDVERDVTQPIVSLSLGCSAVLLLGGRSRDEAPTAMLVRHGDAAVFTGPARMYYHGVPRVFDDGSHAFAQGGLPSLRPDLRDFLRHTRINISIRAVS